MTEREMADFVAGPGWSKKVDSDLHDLKESSKRVEGKIATFIDRQTEQYENDKRWRTRTEKRIEALEAEDDDGDDEITGVHSVDAVKRRARSMRARNRKMSRNAKIAAPALVGIGMALVEFIRAILERIH